MIHFFPRFSKTAEDTPFGQSLREIGVEHRIFGTAVSQEYKYRFQLLLIGYPRLAWTALAVAIKSLLITRQQPPRAVVISSDVEVLVFALVRLLPFAARAQIILIPFIFTERRSPTVNWARLLYYRFVLRFVSCAVCHSTLEIERYRRLFKRCGTNFVFVPWGTYVPCAAEIRAEREPATEAADLPRIVAAGRSGRDYPTLAKAAATLPCHLVIICNEKIALGGVCASANLEILSSCFGQDYLRQLLHADIVIVPLRVEEISAGQMVLIQAMALGRPLIVTRTPTISDYLENGVNALLVPRGNDAAMAEAIQHLLNNPAEAAALGRRAQADYTARFSGDAHLRSLVQAIEQHFDLQPEIAPAGGRWRLAKQHKGNMVRDS